MSDDLYTKLTPEQALPYLSEINKALDIAPFDVDQSIVMMIEPEFYPGYMFLDIADYTQSPEKKTYVIYKPGHVVPITWRNEEIYALNDSGALDLHEDNVIDYARFFFTYVRGPKGKFIIAENVDDIPWRDDPPPSARRSIGQMMLPVSYLCENNDDDHELEICFVFKNCLMKALVVITPAGRVSLQNEEILVDDLPVMDDLFGQ